MRVPATIVLLLGACIQDPSMEAANRRPIVGGQAEDGYPAVGLLRSATGLCTATVIAPRIILSAKHCITANTTPAQVTFSTGPTGSTAAGTAQRFFYVGAFAAGNAVPSDDILVIVLDRDPGVGRIPVSRAGVDGRVGASVELIGYGKTTGNANDAGRKRSGTSTISDVFGTTFQTRAGANARVCGGDSGGPVLMNGNLVGVISGTENNCTGKSFLTRVDTYMDLLRQAASWARTGQQGEARDGQRRRDPRDRDGERQSRRRTAEGDDSCTWANDGVCDEPEICDEGTDATDCQSEQDPDGSPDSDSCYCDDLCVDNGDCCADCSDQGTECTCDTTWECDQDEFADGPCACDPECTGDGDPQCYCDDLCAENGDCCTECPDGGEAEQCYCDDLCVDNGDCCTECPDGGAAEQCYCDDVCEENGDCCADCWDAGDEQCYCDDICDDNGDCCADCGDLGYEQCYCDDVCEENGDCCADCPADAGGECDAWGGVCACDDGTEVCCDDYAYYCGGDDDTGDARCYCDDLCTDNGDCCDGCWVYGDDWV